MMTNRNTTPCKIRYAQSLLLILLCAGNISAISSKTILEANGQGNTYELINSILAPGYNAVEHPECESAHPGFGRHITEVWDDELEKYVFVFHIHVEYDNDRCTNFDRQRIEIKTYASSPDALIGTVGETVVYKWKFRLPADFKPSSAFTHLHQIKPVGGDADNPLFTLTARKGLPNKMELIHNNSNKVSIVNLSLFEEQWVEVMETIKINPINGEYSIEINNLTTGANILSYTNNQLMTIRSDNDFIRPKWGIYRSLNNVQDLRDETVRFADFSIEEVSNSHTDNAVCKSQTFTAYPDRASKQVVFEYYATGHDYLKLEIRDINGRLLGTVVDNALLNEGLHQSVFDLSCLLPGVYMANLYSGTDSRTIKLIYPKGG